MSEEIIIYCGICDKNYGTVKLESQLVCKLCIESALKLKELVKEIRDKVNKTGWDDADINPNIFKSLVEESEKNN